METSEAWSEQGTSYVTCAGKSFSAVIESLNFVVLVKCCAIVLMVGVTCSITVSLQHAAASSVGVAVNGAAEATGHHVASYAWQRVMAGGSFSDGDLALSPTSAHAYSWDRVFIQSSIAAATSLVARRFR